MQNTHGRLGTRHPQDCRPHSGAVVGQSGWPLSRAIICAVVSVLFQRGAFQLLKATSPVIIATK